MKPKGSAAEAGSVPAQASPDNSVLWDLDGTFEQPRVGSPAQDDKKGLADEKKTAQPSVQSPAASPTDTTQEERRQADRRKAAPPTKPAAGSAAESKRPKDRKADKKAKRERAKQRPAEAKAPKQAVPTNPTRGLKIGKYGAAGILCATAGVAFAVGPRISYQVAQALAPMGNLQVHSGTLIIAGIALIGVGVLRRVLAGIRETVVSVGNETQPLKQLARDNEALRRDVVELRAASNALRTKLDSIQGSTKTWNDSVKESNEALVSQINQLDAMLRGQHKSWRSALEASLQDASAHTVEHIDQALQDLRGHVDEQIESQAQTSSAGITALEAQLDRLDRERGSSVEQLGDKLERTFAASSVALQELRASGEEAQNEAAARGTDMELRLTEEIERRHAALCAGLAAFSEGAQKAARDAATSLEELRDSLERQLEAQSVSQREGLVELETRFELLDHAQSLGLTQLGDRVHHELATESEALKESARANLALAREEAAQRAAELEQRLAAEQQRHDAVSERLTAVLESGQQAARDARAAAEGLEQLGDSLRDRIERQSASQDEKLAELEVRLEYLDQAQAQGLENLGHRVQQELATGSEALQESASTNAELAREEAVARARDLEQRLGAAMQQRHDALSDSLAAVAESAHQAALDARTAVAGPQELRDYLEQRIEAQSASQAVNLLELEARLDRQHQNRASSLEQLGERLGTELAAETERLERLEQQVLEQFADFRSLMLEAPRSSDVPAPDVKQDLDLLATQIEEALMVHTDLLASELMAVADLSRETTAALMEYVTVPAHEAAPAAPAEPASADPRAEESGTDFEHELEDEPPFASGVGEPQPFGYDLEWNEASPVSEPQDESEPVEGVYGDIPPALPRAVEGEPAPELLEQPAGDPENALDHDCDAPGSEEDPFYGPNSDYGF